MIKWKLTRLTHVFESAILPYTFDSGFRAQHKDNSKVRSTERAQKQETENPVKRVLSVSES